MREYFVMQKRLVEGDRKECSEVGVIVREREGQRGRETRTCKRQAEREMNAQDGE